MTGYFQQSLDQLYESQPDATVVVTEGQPAALPDDIARLTLIDSQNRPSASTIRLA